MERGSNGKFNGIMVLLGLMILGMLLMNICIGSVRIPLREVIAVFRGGTADPVNRDIVLQLRFPRALAAMLLGGGLALSGYLLQTYFHNPIAGPYILGISSGAKLMVAVTMVVLAGNLRAFTSVTMIAAAFLGAMMAMGLVLLVARVVHNMAVLVVAGVMIGYICSAITEIVVTFAADSDIVNLHNWSRGSFSGITWNNVLALTVITVLCVIAAVIMAKSINAYQMGEQYASSVGVNVKVFRVLLVHCSTPSDPDSPAYCGPEKDHPRMPAGRGTVLPRLRFSRPHHAVSHGDEYQHGHGHIRCAGCHRHAASQAEGKGGERMNDRASIRCENISVGYGDHVVVSDASLMLHKGEILTLIGPNGAGKSTLLKTLARVLPLKAGTVYLSGQDLMSFKNRELAQKMAVLLTHGKDPGMITCREVIEMGRFPYTNMAGTITASDRTIVEEAMEQTGVRELAQRDYTRISDGQRQRVLLARALCQQPEILILDEPISYLDIKYKLEFLTTLQRLVKQRDITVVMTLHELDLAARVSDRIACIKDGKIHRMGTPEEVMEGDYMETLFDLPAGSYDAVTGSVEMEKIPGASRVFVLCGTGNGTGAFRALQRRQIPFDAGILWRNDRDLPAAKALARSVIETAPFATVTDEAIRQAEKMIDGCETVICTLEETDRIHPAEHLRTLMCYAEQQGKLRDMEDLFNG